MTTISTIVTRTGAHAGAVEWLAPPPFRIAPTATARSARGSPSFATQNRAREPGWFNAPVASFGDPRRGC